MKLPEVSVVMAVRNDAPGLEIAARSILDQESIDLELLIVDDGSTDETSTKLRELEASDSRVQAFVEPHRGLTNALILGCGSARARVLARQDAGDYSFPWRLRSQLDLLEREPSVSFVSCWTECIGPRDEPLQVVRGGRASDAPVRLSLKSSKGSEAVGPTWHGSTLFRRDAYLRTGGYRPEFRMAQDWDLWWRLSETGAFALVPRVLYRARLVPDSLSMCHPGVQRRFAKLGREAFEARLAGGGDQAIVERAQAESEKVGDLCQTRAGRARGDYFIGSLLRSLRDPRSRDYFRSASRSNPLHLKAWMRWIQTR